MRAFKVRVDRFWAKVRRGRTCWIWTGPVSKNGYGRTGILGRQSNASRAAYILTFGDVPAGLCVCHHCDNPLCVRPDHLFVGTHRDNLRDAKRKGRMACPLTDDEWRDVLLRVASGESKRKVGRDVGVSHSAISWQERHGLIAATIKSDLDMLREAVRFARESGLPSSLSGSRSPLSRLRPEDCLNIARAHAGGRSNRALAKEYGVSHAAIIQARRWVEHRARLETA